MGAGVGVVKGVSGDDEVKAVTGVYDDRAVLGYR